MSIQNLVSFCQFVFKLLSKNQILTWIKGHNSVAIKGSNSVANLQKTKIYNTNIDQVNDNVFPKFGLILSIRSKDIEQKQNSDINQAVTLLQICEKEWFTIPTSILSMNMCIQNLFLIGLYVFKILSKN